jgi:hypothetical protein
LPELQKLDQTPEKAAEHTGGSQGANHADGGYPTSLGSKPL